MNNWHLRFAVTSACNFKCKYCHSHGKLEKGIPDDEIKEILKAAYENNIQRVHWTGGEPLVKKNILELMHYAKDLGYQEQSITTNGQLLGPLARPLVDAGVSRFNISLDTLDPDLFGEVTTVYCLDQVLQGLDAVMTQTDKTVKINMVVMKDNLHEVGRFIKLADGYNTRFGQERILIRFLQFFPCQPNQLSTEGQTYWKQEYVTEKEILMEIAKEGAVERTLNCPFAGDNPTMRYYKIMGKNVSFGLLAMFSWGYVCGDCHKLLITPQGMTSVCLNDNEMFKIQGLPYEEKKALIAKMIDRRNVLIAAHPERKHYRKNLGEVRFGKTMQGMELEEFYKIAAEQQLTAAS